MIGGDGVAEVRRKGVQLGDDHNLRATNFNGKVINVESGRGQRGDPHGGLNDGHQDDAHLGGGEAAAGRKGTAGSDSPRQYPIYTDHALGSVRGDRQAKDPEGVPKPHGLTHKDMVRYHVKGLDEVQESVAIVGSADGRSVLSAGSFFPGSVICALCGTSVYEVAVRTFFPVKGVTPA